MARHGLWKVEVILHWLLVEISRGILAQIRGEAVE